MESKILQEIIENILTYKEDNEHIKLTPKQIKSFIEVYLDELANEVYNELSNY